MYTMYIPVHVEVFFLDLRFPWGYLICESNPNHFLYIAQAKKMLLISSFVHHRWTVTKICDSYAMCHSPCS